MFLLTVTRDIEAKHPEASCQKHLCEDKNLTFKDAWNRYMVTYSVDILFGYLCMNQDCKQVGLELFTRRTAL